MIVEPRKDMQNFDSKLLSTGITHSQMVKAIPVESNFIAQKSIFSLPTPTAVS